MGARSRGKGGGGREGVEGTGGIYVCGSVSEPRTRFAKTPETQNVGLLQSEDTGGAMGAGETKWQRKKGGKSCEKVEK